MKKYLFFFCYFGDDKLGLNKIHDRVTLIKKEIELLRTDIFDKKFIIPVSRKQDHLLVKAFADQYNLEIYKHALWTTNLYEYPGFLAMQQVAKICEEDTLFFYGHAKGTGNPTKYSFDIYKLHIEKLLIDNIEQYFDNPEIQKVGLFPSKEGWLWFNFFWIRSNYIKNKIVEISDDRYHYESLIGNKGNLNDYKSCLSVLDESHDLNGFQLLPHYTPDDLEQLVNVFK